MSYIDEFISDLTPGNYFLTKSMEPSRINSSGTLWYLKKFLVLYDAIFLSKTIRKNNGITEIKENFEAYISTLPAAQQADAERLFFPENIDIRGAYRTYGQFAGPIDAGDSEKEVHQYLALVDKYYFVYLMNLGGQSGINAFLKSQIYNTDFTVKNLDSFINKYKIKHPEETRGNTQIINDYHAALRNERQILFYFGFVHSRSNGAGNDKEFSSLTPIGELAVHANAKEFALIWEHQKLKMISQPVTIEMPSIKNCPHCDVSNFKINSNPYTTILKFLSANDELPPRYYDLVISRTNDSNVSRALENYDLLKNNLDRIKSTIDGYNVKSDSSKEDFEKEIKKYLLGIRSDLAKDYSTNYFGCVKAMTNNAWKVTDSRKLAKLLNIYLQIEGYKLAQYRDLFANCEKELKNKYIATISGNEYRINHRVKMSWDLYNIRRDRIVFLALIVNDYIMSHNVELDDVAFDELLKYGNRFFSNIFNSVGLTRKIDIARHLESVFDALRNQTLYEMRDSGQEYDVSRFYVNKYSKLNSNDIWNKIIEVSKENIKTGIERKRDSRIVNMLGAYYLANYSDQEHLIKCECCGQTTFLKNNDEPYLEYHHLIPFNEANGPDHYENIFGICPTCHRKLHHIKDSCKAALYNDFNINNHLQKTILDRLKDLYSSQILKSYQLEYALSENMINEDEYNSILA